MDDNTLLDGTDTTPTPMTVDWDEDVDIGACVDHASDGVYSTNVNLIPPGDHTNFATDLTGNFEGYEDTYGCLGCWELYFAGIMGECTCGEEYTGCVAELSISNESSTTTPNGGVCVIDLTFDYDVSLNQEVTTDSYINLEISSESWETTISTAISVSSGEDSATGTKTVSLTDEAEPSYTPIKIKFNTR